MRKTFNCLRELTHTTLMLYKSSGASIRLSILNEFCALTVEVEEVRVSPQPTL